MDHHCQIANKCIGLFNKRLYLLFVTSIGLLTLTNLIGLFCGNEINEIIWLGMIVNILTLTYIASMLRPAVKLASLNIQQIEEVRMLGVFDRLRGKRNDDQELIYFYTRPTNVINITE